MPPKRCPDCGRFLSNEFVASLAAASAPCPRCETSLSPDSVVGGSRAQPHATGDGDRAKPGTAGGGDRAQRGAAPDRDARSTDDSVRPPDLDPAEVSRQDLDVLAGWDLGATPEEVASWRADNRPFPADTVVIVSGTLVGATFAGLLARQHRAGWIAAGALGGAGIAGAARRIWELRP